MDVFISCDQGRECVIRILEVMKFIMKNLHSLTPNAPQSKKYLLENLTNIQKEFQYLRLFYDVCMADTPQYTHLENCIPFVGDKPKEPSGEAYVNACKEREAVRKELDLQNKRLVEIIRHLRQTTYEINCMLAVVNTGSGEEKD